MGSGSERRSHTSKESQMGEKLLYILAIEKIQKKTFSQYLNPKCGYKRTAKVARGFLPN